MYEILHEHGPSDTTGRVVDFALVALIAANVVANILETDEDIAASAPAFFRTFEIVSVIVFTLEYVLRLWSAAEDPRFAGVRGRLHAATRPMAIIDLAAFAPFYLTLLAPGALDLRYLRVLRLLRIFRLARSRRISEAFAVLARVIRSKRAELGMTLAVILAAVVVAAGLMYLVEHQQPDTAFTSIPRAMWWAVITVTTIGYGDMVPGTPLGQLLGGFVGFVGICALALPVGILSSGFIDELNRKDELQRQHDVTPHVCSRCGHTEPRG